MSSEGFTVTNPRNNNRDLVIKFKSRNGTEKKLETLRPGETCRIDKRFITIEEVARPPRLLLCNDGSVVLDRTNRKSPRASGGR